MSKRVGIHICSCPTRTLTVLIRSHSTTDVWFSFFFKNTCSGSLTSQTTKNRAKSERMWTVDSERGDVPMACCVSADPKWPTNLVVAGWVQYDDSKLSQMFVSIWWSVEVFWVSHKSHSQTVEDVNLTLVWVDSYGVKHSGQRIRSETML